MAGEKQTPEKINEEEWFAEGKNPEHIAMQVHWQEAESLALEGFDKPPEFQELSSEKKLKFAEIKLGEVKNQITNLVESDIPAGQISDKLNELNERRMILELFCDDARQRIMAEGASAVAEPEKAAAAEGENVTKIEEGIRAKKAEKAEEGDLSDLSAVVEMIPEIKSPLREYIAKTNETITGWRNMRDSGFVKGGPEWQKWMGLRKELDDLFKNFPPDLQKALIKVDIGRKKGREDVSKMLDEMEEKAVIEKIKAA